MRFHELNVFVYFDLNFTEVKFVLKDVIDNEKALVQIMA